MQVSVRSVGGAYWSWAGSWCKLMLWRNAEIALTRPSVNEVKRSRLLELATAAGGRDCFGALQMEH